MKWILFIVAVLLVAAMPASRATFFIFAGNNNILSCPAGNLQKDANGWTIFCATATTNSGTCGPSGTANGTCITYVSSSTGNDSTCAAVVAVASSFTPCATLVKAQTLMRSGDPDWMLLKRGDTFTPDGSNNNFGTWTKSGASATAPMIIGSYDPSQPGVVNPYASGSRPLIENNHSVAPIAMGGSGGYYLAIVGLEFYNNTADPNNVSYNPSWVGVDGISIAGIPSNWLLIEDCKLSFYAFNANIEPANSADPNVNSSALYVNRNVIVAAYSASAANSSGFFTPGNNGYANNYLTENIFDHNGWNATAVGGGPSSHNHNVYIDCSSSGTAPDAFTTINGNIFGNDSTVSAFRQAGTYSNNLFAYVPNGVAIGGDPKTAASCNLPPTNQSVTYNVVLDANYNTANVGGGGFGTINLITPANITNNILSTYASTNVGVQSIFVDTPTSIIANADMNYTNNTIWDWSGGVFNDCSSGSCSSSVPGSGNTFSPNNYNCTTCNGGGAYSDPYRSVGSYYATLSGATSSASVTGTINNCSPSCAGSSTSGNIMNVTAVGAGALNIGDAITFAGQSHAVVIAGNSTIGPNLCGGSACTGTGGTGTYAVNIANGNCGGSWSSCTPAGAVPLLVTSQTLTDYSYNGFVAKAATSSKGSDLGNTYRACLVNDYIRAGFGLAAQGCPTNG